MNFTFPQFTTKMPSGIVEVFKTDISDETTANLILSDLSALMPSHHFNFDLEDRDRILRVEVARGTVQVDQIIRIVKSWNKKVEVLE